MGIFAGMKFNNWRAEPHGRLKLAFFGRNKQADADSGIGEPRNDGRNPVVLTSGIQTALGSTLFAPFGHDASGVRTMPQSDFQHFVGRGHFQIEWQVGGGLDAGKIIIADMTAIFA